MPANPSQRKQPSALRGVPQVPECLLRAVDMLDLGILLVGREGRIAFANHAAETLLHLRKGSRIGGQTPGQSRPITATLDRQLRTVIKRGRSSTERHVALTMSGGRSLFLLSVPCAGGDGDAADDAMDILFVSEPSRHSLQDLSSIARHYGLTRAETRLLQALVKGDTISVYAKRVGITLNTAKGYLKQLFRKTATTRQSDLVRLILANPILHLVGTERISARRE